jgi:hypothetical protein
MAAKKKTAKPKTRTVKPKTKTIAKTKVKPAPKKGAKSKGKSKPAKAKAKTRGTKPPTRAMVLAAASDDPMGCCTWTNSAGQLMMRNMRQSQCAKISGATFEAGVKCNG